MPDESRPATQADIGMVRGELQEVRREIQELKQHQEQHLEQRLDRFRDELVEQMRDMQTELLRAFHGWARSTDVKLRSVPLLDERVSLLEERVSAIERRDKPSGLPFS